MGIHSYSVECPFCHNEMDCWGESHSNEAGGECLHCGYIYWTASGRKSLEELNEDREDAELQPLTKKEYDSKNENRAD